MVAMTLYLPHWMLARARENMRVTTKAAKDSDVIEAKIQGRKIWQG